MSKNTQKKDSKMKAKDMEQSEKMEQTVKNAENAAKNAAKETESIEKAAEKQNEEESPMEAMKQKIAALEQTVAKDKDDYIRLMAEFDNYRRRTSQEKIELVSMASVETIKGLLPILDDCERAMKVLKESNDSEAAKEGTELIYSKLLGYLKSKGLAVIEAMGETFDTDLHEAVAQFPVAEDDKKGKVFDVVQTGYTLNGKVIRFAKVVVGI
jgi:molecular chaperone GrpE